MERNNIIFHRIFDMLIQDKQLKHLIQFCALTSQNEREMSQSKERTIGMEFTSPSASEYDIARTYLLLLDALRTYFTSFVLSKLTSFKSWKGHTLQVSAIQPISFPTLVQDIEARLGQFRSGRFYTLIFRRDFFTESCKRDTRSYFGTMYDLLYSDCEKITKVSLNNTNYGSNIESILFLDMKQLFSDDEDEMHNILPPSSPAIAIPSLPSVYIKPTVKEQKVMLDVKIVVTIKHHIQWEPSNSVRILLV